MQKFKIISLVDSIKNGSELMIGNIYKGNLSKCGTKIYYTDNSDTDWIFYINDTCELIN